MQVLWRCLLWEARERMLSGDTGCLLVKKENVFFDRVLNRYELTTNSGGAFLT